MYTNFLIEHESYHVDDKETIVWKREFAVKIPLLFGGGWESH